MKIWKDIPGLNGNYRASACGEIQDTQTGRILSQYLNKKVGYLYVNIIADGKRKCVLSHRLIASAFVGNPEGKPETNHINGIKTDNCAKNLEWCTRQENADHAKEMGLYLRGNKYHRRTEKDEYNAKLIKQLSLCGIRDTVLAKEFGVSRTAIYKIRTGRSYGYLNL